MNLMISNISSVAFILKSFAFIALSFNFLLILVKKKEAVITTIMTKIADRKVNPSTKYIVSIPKMIKSGAWKKVVT